MHQCSPLVWRQKILEVSAGIEIMWFSLIWARQRTWNKRSGRFQRSLCSMYAHHLPFCTNSLPSLSHDAFKLSPPQRRFQNKQVCIENHAEAQWRELFPTNTSSAGYKSSVQKAPVASDSLIAIRKNITTETIFVFRSQKALQKLPGKIKAFIFVQENFENHVIFHFYKFPVNFWRSFIFFKYLSYFPQTTHFFIIITQKVACFFASLA